MAHLAEDARERRKAALRLDEERREEERQRCEDERQRRLLAGAIADVLTDHLSQGQGEDQPRQDEDKPRGGRPEKPLTPKQIEVGNAMLDEVDRTGRGRGRYTFAARLNDGTTPSEAETVLKKLRRMRSENV